MSSGLRAQVLGTQIFLATPSDCPVNADGSKRHSSGGGGRSVSLLVSTDEALSFAEACIPIRFLDQAHSFPRSAYARTLAKDTLLCCNVSGVRSRHLSMLCASYDAMSTRFVR